MSDPIAAMRKCHICNVRKPAEEFYTGDQKRPCRECHRGYLQERYAPRAALLDKIKTDSGCIDCGYNAHPQALEFDHLPQFEKLNRVSAYRTSGSEEEMMAEIEKCEIVCANCHRLRTVNRPYQHKKLSTPKGGIIVYGALTDHPTLFDLTG